MHHQSPRVTEEKGGIPMGQGKEEEVLSGGGAPDFLEQCLLSAYKKFFIIDASGKPQMGDGKSILYDSLIRYFGGKREIS